MVPEPKTVTTADGTVGFYEYGDPGGRPVMVFHGVPACGAGFAFADAAARERRLRLIAPDRPGIGWSELGAVPWTIESYPAMVARLADALDIDRFAVWGYSGGGPYAVATAASLGGRVTSVAVAAGMGEVGGWAEVGDFEKTDRQMLNMARRRPRLARMVMAFTGRLARMAPGTAVKSFIKQLPEPDREVLLGLGPPSEAMALFTQVFLRGALRGARGVVADYQAVGQRWDVDLDSITAPVTIFQGDADTMVPPRHSDELAKRIAGSRLVVWPGEGHLGTIRHVDQVLESLTD